MQCVQSRGGGSAVPDMFYELTQKSTSGTFLCQNICKENAHKTCRARWSFFFCSGHTAHLFANKMLIKSTIKTDCIPNLISVIMTHVINKFITP